MWDAFVHGISWLLLIFFGGQAIVFVGLVMWAFWNNAIEPMLISADDIGTVADDIINSYLEPELEAFARQERAWHESDGAGQAYWYRVRKIVRLRLENCGISVK
ncbi:MAG: hypothetical protein JSR13_20515 [Proteobacteria bacterium]|jgi:hypothetical protein|uniref:hypothetical protein n=1 Tax=Agrobacterium sp. T29 TaxID=2580515 RepID=UPI00115CFDA7|nr:hypothetical protein [Agrobacterium sp. T29]MBS0260102.1 hypothetical protein [Pseudomonadota bacterium]